MASPFVIVARVGDDGKLLWRERDKLSTWIKQYAGELVRVTFQKHREKRTLDQNAYWWAEPVPTLAEYCGYTPNQMHYVLLGECFGYIAGPKGNAVPIKPSSSDLNVEEFKRLIDWVLIWGPSELGCAIMHPDEWQKRDGV